MMKRLYFFWKNTLIEMHCVCRFSIAYKSLHVFNDQQAMEAVLQRDILLAAAKCKSD